MKRLLAAGIALFLLILAPFAPGAMAEEDLISLSVGVVDGKKDETVSLAVSVENPGGMDSLQFSLNYDPTALSLIEIVPGELTAGGIFVYNTEVSGVAQAAFASALGLSDGGVFLTLRFKLLTDAGSAVVLTDALASRVDAEYVQTKAYLQVADGGVTASGAAMPAGVVTPWPVETPQPTPTPEPTPTPTPTPSEIEPVAQQSETPEATPEAAEPAPEEDGGSGTAAILIAAGAALIVTAGIILLLAHHENKKRAMRKKRRAKNAESAPEDNAQ